MKRISPIPLLTSALALFFAVLALLAFQMRAGHDPVLGSGRPLAALVRTTPGGVVLHTTSSGRVVSTPAPSAQPAPALHTQASGARSVDD